MSDSDRSEFVALVAVVCTVLVFVIGLAAGAHFWPRKAFDQPIEQPNAAAAEYYQEQRGPAEGYWWPEVAARDTYAQWAMSVLALVATATGILGVIWIRQTLEATRDTAKAAIDSAKAAQDAVGAERAWMTVAGTTVNKAENSFYNGRHVALMYGVSIRWVNDGRSPAVNSVATVIPRYSTDVDVPIFDATPRSDGKAIVGPGREVSTSPIWLSVEQCEAINSHQEMMFVYVRFDYQDVFDLNARRHTESSYRVEILRTEDNWISVNLSPMGPQNSAA